jgi:hypothetical protein
MKSANNRHQYEINPWTVGIGLTVGLWLLIELCVKAALT